MKHCGFNFSTKLAVLSNSLPHKKALTLPSLTTQPHQVLASDLVPYLDIQQVRVHCWLYLGQVCFVICVVVMSLNSEYFHFFLQIIYIFTFYFLQVSKIAAYAYSAISQIKVDAKEELVVQFAIP